MMTSAMRGDGRGRHTTTLRRLVTLPGGASIVDTPGMRSFLPWARETDVDAAFRDVASAANGCRFADCTHDAEPGCAVLERKRKWKAIHKAARRANR
ncbi:MAG TPA: GTPase RsgA [Candidatus Baltobacteraceae bacterium]|jgi:ribosome biogenesis GTPase|nr:GTPase RsgA [Candidatus Baltobacteraceae bacterium]